MEDLQNDPRLLNAMKGLKTILDLTVNDEMQTDFITVDASDLLAKAARTMIEQRQNGLIVMKDGKLFSILSSWDLLHKSYLESFSDKMDYLKTPLEQVIENPVTVSLTPTSTLAEAVSIFASGNFRKLPVLDGEDLVGIFTITDLIKVYDRLILESQDVRKN